jgi:transcriptional regulator with XRE-family HTH domain
MTPADFRAVREAAEITERGIARATGWSPGAVRNWTLGKAAVPAEVAAWLQARAEALQPLRAPQKPL